MSAFRACLVALCPLLIAAAPPQKRPVPLPDGAVARFGDSRFVTTNDSYVNAVAWSPDGRFVASGGLYVSVWDVKTARVVREMPGRLHPYVKALAWSKDGRLLAGMKNDSKFTIWRAEQGKPYWEGFREPAGKHRGVVALRFVGGDRFLAVVTTRETGAAPREDETPESGWRVELWDVEKGTLWKAWTEDEDRAARLKAIGSGYQIRHVALSPSGERMVWLASSPPRSKQPNSVALLYETASGKLLHSVEKLPRTYRADLPDEGRTLVLYPFRPEKVEKQQVRQGAVVGIADGKVRHRFDYRFLPPAYENPYSSLFRGSGFLATSAVRLRDSLVTIDEVGMIRQDWQTGKKQEEFGRPVTHLALSADGQRLAICAGSEGARFSISDGKLAPLENDETFVRQPWISFLPDGRLRVQVNDRLIPEEGVRRVWIRDARKGVVLERQHLHPWPARIDGASADEEGKMLVGYRDGGRKDVIVHDLVANKQVCQLESVGSGYSVEMSPDGTRVLAYSNEHLAKRQFLVRWFDARTGRELGRFDVENRYPGSTKDSLVPLTAAWHSRDGSLFAYSPAPRRLTLVDCRQSKAICILQTDERWPNLVGDHLLASVPAQSYPVEERYRNKPPTVCTLRDLRGRTVRHYALPADQIRMPLTPDGRLHPCMVRPKELIVYETLTGRPRFRVPLPRDTGDRTWAYLSPDGKLMATAHADHTVLVWDVDRLRGTRDLPVPKDAEQAVALWQTLGDADPAKAEPALRALAAAPERALSAMKGRLGPAKAADRPFARPNEAPACLREIRALEVLERIGTAEAKALVKAVAGGHDDALLTLEAKQVLARWR